MMENYTFTAYGKTIMTTDTSPFSAMEWANEQLLWKVAGSKDGSWITTAKNPRVYRWEEGNFFD